jgi:microcystin-dependent protein
MDQYLGEIQMFAFSFAPKFWATCSGQLLPLNQNQALFSLLGAQFGGNGITNFALPDLRGRSMVGFGSGGTLPEIVIGQSGGTLSATLVEANMPSHTHAVTVPVNTAIGTASSVVGNRIAASPNAFKSNVQNGSFLKGVTAENTGQSIPFSIQNPYLGINHCIALTGIFPSRP